MEVADSSSPPRLSVSAPVSSSSRDTPPPLFNNSMSPARARHDTLVAPETFKNTKRAIITINKEGVIVSCNNAARFLFGYPLGSMVGARVEKLMPEQLRASHQSFVDAAAALTAPSFVGKWKSKDAVGFKGDRFVIRLSISKSLVQGEPTFSALIEPLCECTIWTDETGVISKTEGSPSLLFGCSGEELLHTSIFNLLQSSSDWRLSSSSAGKVIVARDAEGEDFAATLRVRRDGALLCGRFSEAPRLRMRLLVSEDGTVLEASGDTHAFVGYKTKSLKSCSLSKLVKAEEMATVVLDEKSVVSLRCKNGLSVFASVRLTKVRQPDGSVAYDCLFKSSVAGEGKSVLRASQALRYDGPEFGWYELGPSLGYGICGPVRRAVHRLTREEVAIKTLSRARYRELNMVYPPPEVRLLEKLRHPNLVRLLDVIWSEDDVYLVLELINGGEFFEYCMAAGALPEQTAQGFWRQLLSAVDYLHREGVCHRDIKLENLVLDSNLNLKLVDLGFACSFYEGEKLKVFCGSPDYAAVELVGMTEYEGPKVDIWALGVVLYVMLTGFIPFSSPTRILQIKYQWPQPAPSTAAQNLVKLIFKPAESRASMETLLAHEWTTAGWSEPLRSEAKARPSLRDDIIADMEARFGWSRDAIEAALAAHHVSSQVATTYHLLEYAMQRKGDAPQNPIWKLGKGVKKGKEGCSLQ